MSDHGAVDTSNAVRLVGNSVYDLARNTPSDDEGSTKRNQEDIQSDAVEIVKKLVPAVQHIF